jgi:hypothetical protein
MNHVRNLLASATRRLARIAGGLLLPVAVCAAAAEPPVVLVHRFTVAEPGEWVSIELRPSASVWYRGISGSPTARMDEVRAVLGSLKGVAIGARCPGRTEGPIHYPCAFDVDSSQHESDGDSGEPREGWISTTMYKLMRPEEGTVSALSTPSPAPGSFALAGDAGLLALIAPVAFEAQWAQDRPLRVRVRVRLAPVADDGISNDSARRAHARTFPAQGVIVISTQPLRPQPLTPQPTKPALNGKHNA